jgi:hypothetical protein
MRRAGHKRSVFVRATPQTAPGARNGVAVAVRLLDEPLLPITDEVETICGEDAAHRGAQQQALEIVIQQRIESRLQGRVRNLMVRAYGDVVILEGQCATYYTKQLAQHAAMGILEDEHLENAIVVSVPK